MDAATWLKISIIGYSLAGVLFVVAIIMFFKMNILAIIGDLSGKTAARKIKEIREHNKGADNKRLQPKAFRLDRESKRLGRTAGLAKMDRTGGLTGKFRKTNSKVEETQLIAAEALSTELLPKGGNDSTVLLGNHEASQSTALLSEGHAPEATVLLSEETEILSYGTTILAATALLENEAEPAFVFKVEKDIEIVHTNEVI
ncbi:hypothetical protein [Neobacillus niacini]|uniref:hypothetical protein n=1 Tax=Neobacillus niacini TaxID=86668 RepID=UPI0021CB42A2|nr:hypothetical protein [Neobacillus niacini]MCM3763624.1 hypothetical protein [Neobacillus niacini]